MLEPLDDERLAGVLKYEKLLLLLLFAFDCCCCCFGVEFNFLRKFVLSVTGFVECRFVVDAVVFDGVEAIDFDVIFRTVFIDAELFNDDLELRKLVRDPLRSTSCRFDVIAAESTLRRSEFVLFGMMLLRDCGVTVVDAARNDRLLAKL